MATVIPSSLDEFLPSQVKSEAVQIENSGDLFLVVSQIEVEQKMPDFVIIRTDLIPLFDKVIRTLETFKLQELTLVEDRGVVTNNLDMHWRLIPLAEFLSLLNEDTRGEEVANSSSEDTAEVQKPVGEEEVNENDL